MISLKKIRSKSTEELRERKKELYNKITKKQNLMTRYERLLAEMAGNCSDYIIEYEMIDRIVFVREGRVNFLPPTGRGKERKIKKLPVKREIEDLSKEETEELLKQLLAIKQNREQNDSLQNTRL